METGAEKLSVLLGIKFTATMAAELKRAAGGERKRPELIRRFCAEGLKRRTHRGACRLTCREEAAIGEARAMRVDLVATLRAAIAQKISNP